MIPRDRRTEIMSRPKLCIIQYNSSRFLTRVDRAARTLSEAGFEVVLVAIKDEDTERFEDRGSYRVRRVVLTTRRLPAALRVFRFIEAVAKTFWVAFREDADVYDPRDAEPLLVAHAAALLRGAKVVYDSDELCLDRNKPVTRRRWWRAAMRRFEGFFARRSDAVITTDHGRADVLASRYGIPRPTVILNVPTVIETLEPDEGFRRDVLGDKEILLIYQGVLIENRGIPEMMRAMRRLPRCRLALVGYGHQAEAYRRLAAREDLDDSVRFVDPVPFDVLMRYTAAADVGMIPLFGSCLSYELAAPNKLFEYMMAGLPVVVTDLPDMAAVVGRERVGTLISDPTDPESIASAVSELLDGDEPLTSIGTRAREAALARYNWTVERAKLLDVYESLGLSASA
jgi:glycosyltransferase involved in cell wall biosynthesis